MYRRTRKIFAAALVLTMLLTMTVFQGIASAATTTTRLGGNNRYETAAKVATEGWTTAATAVVVRGDQSADALVAAPLAKLNDAPILLTASNELSAATKTALTTLKTTKVIIVGGTSAVSAAVENAIKALNITVERVYGDSRYATSVEVAKKLGTFTEVAFANAYAPADALSVSSIAAAKGMPILFTDKASLPKVVSDYLTGKTVKAYLIGGTGVIADAVYAGATRLGGDNRYATNRAVLAGFADVKYDKVFLATSQGADALTGSALAAKTFSPLVLVDKAFDATTLTYVTEKATTSSNIVVLGGATVITDATVNSLITAISNYKFQVTEVKAISATKVMVKFNKPVNEADAETFTGAGAKYSIGTATITGAELQSDKISVVLTLSAPLTGTNLYIVQPVALAADTTVKTPIFTFVETYSDTVAPSVVKVTYPTFDKAEVTFSEPMKGLGNVTVSQDGSSLGITPTWSIGDSVATFDLSSAAADKAITVALVGAIDMANNLISPNPTTLTLTKVKADTTAPSVAEVKALSNNRISIKFSEKLSVAPTTVQANGEAVTLSTTDSITYTGVMANAVSGIGKVIVSGDYKDMSGNTGSAYTSGLLQFTADTTAPKLVNSEVKTIDNKLYLVLNFDEDVTKVGGSISGTRVKDYVWYDFSVVTPAVSAYTDHPASVKVDISDNTAYPAGVYTVTIPAGFVVDTAVPTAKNSEAATITFTKVIAASADTDKPTVNAPVAFTADNKYMDVVFSESMDPATALNVYNYSIGGRVIFTDAKFYKNDYTVRLTVAPGTVVYTGNYYVNITGVTDKAGNRMASDYTATVKVVENVAPYVVSAKLTAANTIEVTMSEDVVGVDASADFAVIVNGETLATSAYTLAETSAGKVTITLGTALTDLSKVIQVKLVDGTVTDNADTSIKNPATTGVLVTVTH